MTGLDVLDGSVMHSARRLPPRPMDSMPRLPHSARCAMKSGGETGPIRVRGEHAVERQPYDVALMDVQMAEMDGLEATRQTCARWPRGQRPYLIAMAANAMQGHRELYLEAGIDGYLSKPIQIEELVGALERA